MPQVAIVMPIHPPHYYWARHFAATLLRLNSSSFTWFPVFSTNADKALFLVGCRNRSIDTALWRPMVVKPDWRHPVLSKRLHAIKRVFAMEQHDFALGIDAECEFYSQAEPEPFLHAMREWSDKRVVLGAFINRSNARCDTQATIANRSCELVRRRGASTSSFEDASQHFYWWVHAPLYKRTDYDRFYSAIRWDKLSIYAFDHLAYLCWKVASEGWVLRDIAPSGVQDACHGTDHFALSTQRRISEQFNHSFIWAVGPARGGSRLLRYHLDRHHHK